MPQYLLYPDLYTPLGGWQWWYDHYFHDFYQLYGDNVIKVTNYLIRHGVINA
jgi:hypothetical protein